MLLWCQPSNSFLSWPILLFFCRLLFYFR
uniref:Uncharacterized protein n=1 Tax=Arundo donax TaxID=35708 RepID=A0A0A9GIT0_ARUDO